MPAPSESDNPEVLCSITTAASYGDPPMDWRAAIRDIPSLNLHRFALFLTGLKQSDRLEFYRQLLSLRLRHEFRIPFVHARGDMHPDEYRFLMTEFDTQRFNLHKPSQQKHEHALPEWLCAKIFIENAWRIQASDLEGFAGICLDFSHLQSFLHEDPDEYGRLKSLLERYPIGANHVSSFKVQAPPDGRRDRHFTTDPSDFDYLAGIPRRYYARYVAIELTNPLEEQLEVKKLIEAHIALA